LDPRSYACVECGAQFEFTDEEQRRFEARGFAPPKRCKPCRDAKRRRQAGPPNTGGRGGGRRREGGEPGSAPAARPRDPATMNPANCTVCGEPTEVPFQPDGVRPIYCLPCLKQRTR